MALAAGSRLRSSIFSLCTAMRGSDRLDTALLIQACRAATVGNPTAAARIAPLWTWRASKPLSHPRRLKLQLLEPSSSLERVRVSSDLPQERLLRVLAADDHPTNRAVIEMILGMVGADLVSVEDG